MVIISYDNDYNLKINEKKIDLSPNCSNKTG